MTGNTLADIKRLSTVLGVDVNFDIIRRDIEIGERTAALFFIDGFIKDEVFEKIMEFLFKITAQELSSIKKMQDFSLKKMPYVEVDWSYDLKTVETAVLSGQAVLMIAEIKGALLVDTRTYPTRSINEPEKDKSLRGSRDGFVETMVFNTAMIRRRIRDPRLRMEHLQIGKASKVDVAISYIDGLADKKTLAILKKRLENIKLNGISMTSEAVSEVLVPTLFFNPFPKIKYTERPDYASACVLEGRILLVLDNSPSVMIFATSFADFSRETDDYYFPPLTATYVRIIRFFVTVMTVILTPTVLFLLNNPDIIPGWLSFIKVKNEIEIPIFFQFLLIELVIDGLRLASINTPNSLSNSLGIIGGLLLSEFAISAGWFVPETIIYMSVVAIASFAQPSFEMGYAMKFSRILLLILTQFLGLWGLLGGLLLIILVMAFSKTLSGRGYLYPIIPFNWTEFKKLIIRTKINE